MLADGGNYENELQKKIETPRASNDNLLALMDEEVKMMSEQKEREAYASENFKKIQRKRKTRISKLDKRVNSKARHYRTRVVGDSKIV